MRVVNNHRILFHVYGSQVWWSIEQKASNGQHIQTDSGFCTTSEVQELLESDVAIGAGDSRYRDILGSNRNVPNASRAFNRRANGKNPTKKD